MLPWKTINLFRYIQNFIIIMRHTQVSFTNTEDYLIIQTLIFFINNKQAPMDLYKLHTVQVPLDKDTYDGKESKYMRLDLKQNHLAISKEEYIDLDQHQLNSCLKLHTDYLCPNLRLTVSTCFIMCHSSFSDNSWWQSYRQYLWVYLLQTFHSTTSSIGNAGWDPTSQSASQMAIGMW